MIAAAAQRALGVGVDIGHIDALVAWLVGYALEPVGEAAAVECHSIAGTA